MMRMVIKKVNIYVMAPVCQVWMITLAICVDIPTLLDDHILVWCHEDHGWALRIVLRYPDCNRYLVVVVSISYGQQSLYTQK